MIRSAQRLCTSPRVPTRLAVPRIPARVNSAATDDCEIPPNLKPAAPPFETVLFLEKLELAFRIFEEISHTIRPALLSCRPLVVTCPPIAAHAYRAWASLRACDVVVCAAHMASPHERKLRRRRGAICVARTLSAHKCNQRWQPLSPAARSMPHVPII